MMFCKLRYLCILYKSETEMLMTIYFNYVYLVIVLAIKIMNIIYFQNLINILYNYTKVV